MPERPYLQWPLFRHSVVGAFRRSLTLSNNLIFDVNVLGVSQKL
jgi:hypothetical protein